MSDRYPGPEAPDDWPGAPTSVFGPMGQAQAEIAFGRGLMRGPSKTARLILLAIVVFMVLIVVVGALTG